jgi:hypothetical protein
VKRPAKTSVDIPRDPFGEAHRHAFRWRTRVLGAKVEFTSNHRQLLRIAQDAFAQVPQHRWTQEASRTLRIRLQHLGDRRSPRWASPPKPALSSGAGLLCAHIDSNNFVIVDPRSASALVQVDDAMLRHRHRLRYELVEFAAIMLATREQGLVGLHAGCVGARGRGILLIGASGAGKSTLTLNAALDGLEFLAEDSVFVHPATLHATGLSAYTHTCDEGLELIGDPDLRRAARRAPRIERHSGVRKREIDLRGGLARLARAPLRIVATVVLSPQPARHARPLVPLTSAQLKRVLRAEQPYAAARSGWQEFERGVLRAGGFRLHRAPPAHGASALRELLGEHA